VILRGNLPTTIKEYNYKNELKISCSITDFRYTVSDSNYKDEQTIYLFFSGTKTYDISVDKQSSSCKIGWKLYDKDNNVIDSDTCYTASLLEGESFKDEKDYCFDIKPGTYYLELINIK
jgi:hypothetical protein